MNCPHCGKEINDNTVAISMVPSLLSEVISLRNALRGLLAERYVCNDDNDQEFDTAGNFTCNSPACVTARAALANDKE